MVSVFYIVDGQCLDSDNVNVPALSPLLGFVPERCVSSSLRSGRSVFVGSRLTLRIRAGAGSRAVLTHEATTPAVGAFRKAAEFSFDLGCSGATA